MRLLLKLQNFHVLPFESEFIRIDQRSFQKYQTKQN